MRELLSGKGFADFAFIQRKEARSRPAMIIELKWDKNADTAHIRNVARLLKSVEKVSIILKT